MIKKYTIRPLTWDRAVWPVAALILAIMSGACASTEPATQPVQLDTETLNQLSQQRAAEEYALRYGDVLDIRFYYNPELNVTVPIRPDGRISLELVGEIEAAGLTPEALANTLRAGYSDKLRYPEVTVILTTFSARKIYVGGEVNTPRAIDLAPNQTAFQAIMEVGGFKSTAHLANVVILRDQGTSEPLFFTLDFARTVKLGEVNHETRPDLVLQPNDIVFVPKTRVARWGQLVDQYFTQLVPITLTMGATYFINPLIN